MSYKTPTTANLTLKGIDKKIQDIASHMTSVLPWLTYSFGLADRAVEFRDNKEYIYPSVYQDINSKDPHSCMPNDTAAFSFWVKEPEGKFSKNNPARMYYNISCIFYMDLHKIDPTTNFKITKTKVRQDIIEFFRIHHYGGFGVINPLRIIDDDLTQVYKGFTVSQLENTWRQLPKYAIRMDFEFAFLMECPVANNYAYNISSWFLPSKDTLTLMKTVLKDFSVGGFAAADYWSSSETNASAAKAVSFASGISHDNAKGDALYVRACRTFVSNIAYALRSVGPGGGLVFRIIGDTYYEAYLTDQSTGKAWSNIINLAIGTTGTAVGTGEANTTKIIAQAGHTTSAASICNAL